MSTSFSNPGFPPRVNFQFQSADSLTVFVQPPVCNRTSKIMNTGSHAFDWTHENTAHAGQNEWHCSCGCCSLTQDDLNFPEGIN